MLNKTPGRRRLPAEQARSDRLSVPRAIVLGVLLAALASVVLLSDIFVPSNQVTLNARDVSPVTILAPYDLTYESETQTEQARNAQAASIQDFYDRPDASVARQQEVRARQILDYISSVRQDSYASLEQKTAWLTAIPDLSLSPDTVNSILGLKEDEWQKVRE
ncbi:MAG TPA: hypothetical protein VLY63_16215, partial [Anaerolineae bacterium]|nr:hypothetical protein [Anaerolineae bacterium]